VARTTRIFIVDDHPLFRSGLVALLNGDERFDVVGEAGSAAEALEKLTDANPELLLLDIRMPEMDGLELLEEVRRGWEDLRVVMLTAAEELEELIEAIRKGARGYLLKMLGPAELAGQIERVARGELVVPPAMSAQLFEALSRPAEPEPPSPLEVLSPRELDVLWGLADGLTNKEIAVKLAIAENTVKNHVKRILTKLDIENRTQAATLATRLTDERRGR